MDINPKQFEKSNDVIESSTTKDMEGISKEDDDPLSLKDSSLTFLGIVLAALTILLPSFGVLLERPNLPENGVISTKKL